MTSIDRLAKCGKYRHGASPAVTVKLRPDSGVARYSGLAVCGSVWACPVCSAAIRERRAGEIEEAGRVHLARGGGLEFLTVTVPHTKQDSLATTLGVVSHAWTAVLRSRGFRAVRELVGIDAIRAVEVTYGRNGWHPHLHVLLFTGSELTHDQRNRLGSTVAGAWSAAVVKAGYRAPSAEHGVRLQGVKGAGGSDALARYLTKVQDADGFGRDVAREITRGDLKAGRRSESLTPFELVDRAVHGDRRAAALWREYERATHGRACVTWSSGLRLRLLGNRPEESNEAAATAINDAGEEVLRLSDRQWHLVVRYAWELRVLRYVDAGGRTAGLGDLLAPLERRTVFDSRPRPGPGYAPVRRA